MGAVTADAYPDLQFAVVVARFNSLVTKGLLEGAREAFGRHGVKTSNIDVSESAAGGRAARKPGGQRVSGWSCLYTLVR